jgi:hypothetical protein
VRTKHVTILLDRILVHGEPGPQRALSSLLEQGGINRVRAPLGRDHLVV